ncbi:hypothetical protein K3G39_06945 [Pontibacter sp. HSC-14F20]|uniref:tetratricopeptide repeat protein n=1 Tax=Pontibacter sp. HSC-14F20 TaxID=2864136 RepID=UPI001C72EE3C|nr:hypothetical protein [Pontibacter sp. HSC-14F20]MBX0332970.1 hypothetical protein [Pontibacter sp. HSC-14F20]
MCKPEKNLIATSSNSANFYFEKGNAYDAKQNWLQAIFCYTKAIGLQPDNVAYYIERAESLIMANELSHAKNDYDQVLKLRPTDDYAYYRRATLKLDLGKEISALNDLNKAIELNDEAYEYFALRAEQFIKNAAHIAAIADLTAAIKLFAPDEEIPLKVLEELYLRRAQVNALEDTWSSALYDCEQALAMNPEQPDYLVLKGFCYAGMGMDNEAERILKQAYMKADTTHDYYTWLSTKRSFILDDAGEMADLNEAIEIYNKPESYALRAELKARLNNLEGALEDYREAYLLK